MRAAGENRPLFSSRCGTEGDKELMIVHHDISIYTVNDTSSFMRYPMESVTGVMAVGVGAGVGLISKD